MDRRFGENDPTMTPEEKGLERFVREKQRESGSGALFDLEDAEDDDDGQLTHFGQSLSFDKSSRMDDFNEADLDVSDQDDRVPEEEERPYKRRRLSDSTLSEDSLVENDDSGQPGRVKTKKEVMEEVIAKSKLYKYERQQAKEDDDDLRAELDKGLSDLYALLRGVPRQAPQPQEPQALPTPIAGMNPDRVALLNGKDRSQADKEYDERLRQMAMDQRAAPTVRTMTDEEKLQREVQRLKELEERRVKRMKGDQEDSESDAVEERQDLNGDTDWAEDGEDIYGLGPGLSAQNNSRELDVEDEDDFLMDDNLVASGSELEPLNEEETEDSADESNDDDDEEFVQGLMSKDDEHRDELTVSKEHNGFSEANGPSGSLAYTYKCPEKHEELLNITETATMEDLPTVVRRIRALYHPKLASDNKAKLGTFAAILVDHVSYLANKHEHPPFAVLEALIRHIHSLAKTFPSEISRAFRANLKSIHQDRPTSPTPGDLIILTAIGTIFPTSDHFHQVVTPAMLCMTRYLGQKTPQTLSDIVMGAFVSSLCINYQRISKRYTPEVVNYVLNAIWALMPTKPKSLPGSFPHHSPTVSLRLKAMPKTSKRRNRKLRFWDILSSQSIADCDNQELKSAILNMLVALTENMAGLWIEKSAFCEALDPIYYALRFLKKSCSDGIDDAVSVKAQTASQNIHRYLDQSLQARQPLRLHNHRPLAIKTSIPKFEESYNPDKHYDPDRDRAEGSKLKAEHKRERKGALRELRKDANFVARESLKEKKERDSAYEKKYKRLVAEIQGEEGKEANSYEREKRMRKGKRK